MRKLLLTTVAMLTMATSAFAQLGNLSADLVFTPLTPCRIVDTRNAGGTITAGTARGFKAWGANFTAQGGSNTNCGIPQNTNVAALALNLVVAYPATDGWMVAYPFGGTLPLSSTINYLAGAVLANGAIVKVSQASLAFDWNLHTTSTTHFLADVTGYYSRPISAGSFECIDVAGPLVSVPANASDFQLIAPACTVGYVSVGINYTASGGILRKDGLRNNLFVRNTSASAENATPFSACCRIPGR